MTAPRAADRPQRAGRSAFTLTLLGVASVALAAGFLALGIWQIERRVWKLDLIAKIAARIHAPPTAAPGPDQWPGVTSASSEYRHVTAAGHFIPDADTRVRGVSELGAGYWLLTPLRTTSGFTVLINRGFVPDEPLQVVIAPIAPALQTVTGLLRMSEPKGRVLRANDPAHGRWYSRDVEAIAAAQHLGTVAPYFIDLDGPGDPAMVPVPGLTVVRFPNNHLQYALTWFALSLMVLSAAVYVGRYEWRLRQQA